MEDYLLLKILIDLLFSVMLLRHGLPGVTPIREVPRETAPRIPQVKGSRRRKSWRGAVLLNLLTGSTDRSNKGSLTARNARCGTYLTGRELLPISLGRAQAVLGSIRRFDGASDTLARSNERLSSGLRINRGADDAAGLAISTSLKTDISIFNQAVRNVNDGLSLTNIAFGGLAELSKISIRQKELAEQAANGVYGPSQRQALSEEANTLVDEFNRIVATLEFNVIKPYAGVRRSNEAPQSITIQAGRGEHTTLKLGVNESLVRTVGNGELLSPTSFSAGTGASDVLLLDVNGDGREDMVTADTTAGRVSVSIGNGNGSFAARQSFSAGTAPSSLSSGDLDKDGTSDLVVTDSTTGALNVLFGNGNGSFKAAVSLNGGSASYDSSVVDFDGDGSLDIISSGLIGSAAAVTRTFVSGAVEVTDFTFAGTSTQEATTLTFPNAAQIAAQESRELVFSDASTMTTGQHFLINSANNANQYYVWFNKQNGGGNPNIPGRTGIQVNINNGSNAVQIANSVESALEGTGHFNGVNNAGNLTITNTATGPTANISNVNVGGATMTTITEGAENGVDAGDYFRISSPTTNYYVWFTVNGAGANPSPGGTGLQVALLSSDSSDTVAQKVQTALQGTGQFSVSRSSATLSVTNVVGGAATDAATGTMNSGFSTTTTTQGVTTSTENNDYFTVNSPTTNYYGWFNINGSGVNPSPGGTGVQVNLSWGMTGAQVASAVAGAFDPLAQLNASSTSSTTTITNVYAGAAGSTIGTVTGLGRTVTKTGSPSTVDPAVETITVTGHGYSTGQRVRLTTTGTLPPGLSAGVDYYVIADNANTLRFASSLRDATEGTAIDLGGYGSGTQSIVPQGTTSAINITLGNGNGTFKARKAETTGNGPIALAVSDLNSDGRLDIITADSLSGTVSTRLGMGGGTLGSRFVSTAGATPSSLAIADVDHDGFKDIVAGNSTGTTIDILLGVGNGTFGTRRTLAAGTNPGTVAVADMSGDGILDIITANSGGNNVSILLGEGEGSFGAAKSYAAGAGAKGMAIKDLDGDDVADVATANQTAGDATLLMGAKLYTSTIGYFNLRSQEGAREALDTIDSNMERINQEIATLGAWQSRLQTALSGLAVQREQYYSANERIEAVDIAQESAEGTRVKILQEVAASVLAQASRGGEIALSLLR